MLWKKWAVVAKDGQIQHLDRMGTGRIAVYNTKADAKRDCDPRDEKIIRIRILTVPK